jgi:hypothetical protein
MGYTSVSTSMFPPDMRQTPENVAKVLDIAGWNYTEAAKETGIAPVSLLMAANGKTELPEAQWKLLLDKAGRRSFDHDGDAA